MTQFSGAVKLGDLNDFIAPSQACIVALEGAQAEVLARLARHLGRVRVSVRVRGGHRVRARVRASS